MSLRITHVTTKLGEQIQLGSLTVLVGPNNCGKSQTLKDIRSFITSGSASRLKSLQGLSVELPDLSGAFAHVQRVPEAQSPGHVRTRGVSYDLQTSHEFVVHEQWADQQFASSTAAANQSQILQHMGSYWVAHLDAKGRFNLTAPTDAYDTRTESPRNALQKFYNDRGAAQPSLRSAFREAFGVDIALDWAAMKRWYLRVGTDFGDLPESNNDLNALMAQAEELEEQGDGYKSFAGVVLSILTFPNRLLLLDEPEAFLHPSQARVLGRWLATSVQNRSAQVIIATHSADFLWGVLSANTGSTVIRLNRSASEGTKYKVIPSATTKGLVESPLLSSQPVLDALFHKGVVVCEGDPDRSIYQTVAHKALTTEGGEEVLFIHTNGKDAAKGPVQLLREAGAPVCAILDFDVLNSQQPLDGIVAALTGAGLPSEIEKMRQQIATSVEEMSLSDLLLALIDSAKEWLAREHTDLRTARKSLVHAAKKGLSKWDKVKANGVDYFEGETRAVVEDLLSRLATLGVFVVPCGELENWIDLGMSKGQRWNRAALDRLHTGNCPAPLQAFVTNVLTVLIPSVEPTATTAVAVNAMESASVR